MSSNKKSSSTIGPMIRRYLQLKRALDTMQYNLERLDNFIASSGAGDLTEEVFDLWAASFQHLSVSTRRSRLQEVYRFCLFRRRTDPTCFLPEPDQFPSPEPRPRPYIFSEDEIMRLLAVTDALRPHSLSPLHRQVSRLSIVLLYTTGLRDRARITSHFRIPGSRHLRPLLNREVLNDLARSPPASLNRRGRT